MTLYKKLNKQIILQAAEWAEELDHRTLSMAQRKELAAWLLTSPDHVHELLLATAVFEAWQDAGQEEMPSIEALLAQKAPEVIPLLSAVPRTFLSGRNEVPFWRKPPIIMAGITMACLFFAAFLYMNGSYLLNRNPAQIYTTITGEQRSLPLEDGSVVHMNTATKIQIIYTENSRIIKLMEGEALFHVAHDPSRPFRVYSDNTLAEALGTIFNIYRQNNQTTISVVEGKVAVEKRESKTVPFHSGNNTRLTLSTGERAAVPDKGFMKKTRIENMKKVTSWRIRQLVFERERLSTIVREYNRYNKLQIHVYDPTLAQTKFTGVFDADDPESLVKFLEQTTGITSNRVSSREIHLYKKIQTPEAHL